MECRNCGKNLPEGVLLCQECGFDNAVEEVKIRNPWKYIFPVVVSVVLLAVLGWMIYFGVTGSFLPKANDVYFKDSYTADDARAMANRNTVVATMGEHKLTSGLLQVFYGNQVIQYLNNYGAMFDYTKPLHDQIYDKATGLSWQQFFIECALNSWKYYVALCDMANEAGYEMPKEYRDKIDASAEMIEAEALQLGMANGDALVQAEVGVGCTVEDYVAYLELSNLGKLYCYELEEGMEFPMQQLEDYYTENESFFAQNGITKGYGKLVDVRDILIMPTGDKVDDAYTPEQWDAARAEAERILEQFEKSDKTSDTFGLYAQSYSMDENTAAKGGLLYGMPKHYLSSVNVRHILIAPGPDPNATYSDSEWEEAEKKAQDIYNQYLAGEKTEEVFAELAKQYSQDGNAAQGGIYRDVTKGYMVDTFDAWIFDESRVTGDTGIVTTQFGYHIMYFIGGDLEANKWCFDPDRQAGDTAIIKANDGYHVYYYVYGDEAWIRLAQQALSGVHSDVMVQDEIAQYTYSVSYANITIGNSDLG